MSLFKHRPHADVSPEERARGFARVAGVILGLCAVAFVLGVLQVLNALHSGKVWTNFRGAVVTRSQMHRQLILLAACALLCAALSWRCRRFWRRGE